MTWFKKILRFNKSTDDTADITTAKNEASNIEYFEVPITQATFLCSDNECPCTDNKELIPGKTGYVYISNDVVEMRKDSLTLAELEAKKKRILESSGAGSAYFDQGTIYPILLCEQGARLRKLNLKIAADDAEHGVKTGKFPLRPTPK